MHMDADARNSIIESMAPRAAANTLASMEDALQQQAQDGRPQSPEVCRRACISFLLQNALSDCFLMHTPWM
jgi:hypothetical protein